MTEEKRPRRKEGTGTVYKNGKPRGPGSQWVGKYKVYGICVYGPTYEETELKMMKKIEQERMNQKEKYDLELINEMRLLWDCRNCDRRRGSKGKLREVSGNFGLYCLCGKWQKWIPKKDLGIKPRRSSRKSIKPSLRYRILERDNRSCVICGQKAPDVILHVDHVVSIKKAEELGWDQQKINAEINLQTLCEECNLGKGADNN